MSLHALPQTRGCLVCGRENPHGLHLQLFVDEQSGNVHCDFAPQQHHMGFEGIIHGGLLATVLDEAMVWAATWSAARFCVCGELNVRYRKSASVGQQLRVTAQVVSSRPRLIEAVATMCDPAELLLVEAEGKYVPVPPQRNDQFVAALVDDSKAQHVLDILRRG